MSPPPQRPPAPPELMDELVGEIPLRIPPDEPAHLVRAALVCKLWFQIVSDPAFRRGYRKHHRRPPLLGFVHNNYEKGPNLSFVSITASSCSSPVLDCREWRSLDSRHGRMLIRRYGPSDLVVWETRSTYYTRAVLCAVEGCDHLDCTGGPFLVVFVGTNDEEANTWASVYSSETRGWSTKVTANLSASTVVDLISYIDTKPSVPVCNVLYFTIEQGKAILKYELASQSLSVVDAPSMARETSIVMVAEDGGLGFASIEGDDLHLWSWLVGDGNTGGWKLCKVILLYSLLPYPNHWFSHEVIGFAEGTDIIFVETEVGVFTLNIKSEKTRKVGERGNYYVVLPYMSFCALRMLISLSLCFL